MTILCHEKRYSSKSVKIVSCSIISVENDKIVKRKKTDMPLRSTRPQSDVKIPRKKNFSHDLICSTEQLNNLKSEWQQLFESGDKNLYFQSHEWVSSWWQFYGEAAGYKLSIITVRSAGGGELLLIWPMVVKRYGVCQVGMWPCQDIGQYGDVLIADNSEIEDCLEAVWEKLSRSKIDLLKLSQVREDAKVYSFLSKKGQINGESESTYWVDFQGLESWESYMLSRSKNFRKRQKRMLRQFSELGELSFDVVGDQSSIPEVLSDLLEIKRKWFADAGIYGRIIERPETRDWLIDIAQKAHAQGKLNLTMLRLDNKIVAGQVAFISDNELSAHIGAYDVQYRRFGVGRIQTEDAIRWASENGYQLFDFMPPYDEYKTSWINSEIKVDNFLCTLNFKGDLFKIFFSESLRTKIKKLYAKIPRKFKEKVN